MARKTVKVLCIVEVPFWSYGSKARDRKAEAHITRWIRDALRNECESIPLYVEKDEQGSWIEDCSGRAKIKVVRAPG